MAPVIAPHGQDGTPHRRGAWFGGKGVVAKRHRKKLRDNIRGVTNGSIRRLARRGGVKRISKPCYDEIRTTMKKYLRTLLEMVCMIVECSGRKTVLPSDVVFGLHRLGRPIYGFGEYEMGLGIKDRKRTKTRQAA